ncbi:hypothetical protein [Actinotalea fermentans]|nr:hypothetical protein [Actinotalea fermentans]
MRWQALFADLELQLDAAESRGRLDDVPDLTRAERAAVDLGARLRAHTGELSVTVHGGECRRGVLQDVGPQWVLLADGPREHLVPLDAIAVVAGLGDVAAPPAGVVGSRLRLGHALRAVARDRSVVRVLTTAGTVVGRVDAVGTEHLDVALVRPDDDRPTGARCAVAWSALLVLSRG